MCFALRRAPQERRPAARHREATISVIQVPARRPRGPLDRSRQASPQIFETLRARILSLHLAPNALLSRAALQAEFGVSQTPVRDALMRLDEEGLVEVYPQHATVVARIDVTAARQAHFLRLAVELEALRRLAPQADEALIGKLGAQIARQRRAQAAGDRDAFQEADSDFHACLYDAAAVPELWHVVQRQCAHIDRLRRLNLPVPGKAEAIIADHMAILAAIERRDARGAAEALRRHLGGTLSIIDDIRARHPDYLLEA